MNLFSEHVRRDPFPGYEPLRAAAPVFRDPRTGTWMLSRYDDVLRVLSDHEAFSSVVRDYGPTTTWLIFQDPPRHARLRALISRAFTPVAVAALEPRIREISA